MFMSKAAVDPAEISGAEEQGSFAANLVCAVGRAHALRFYTEGCPCAPPPPNI